MRHLSLQLTPRADDSHAAAVLSSLRISHRFWRDKTIACQARVRSFALFRIKPHAPLVVRVPVNSFEFQPCGRTPQAACLTRQLTPPIPPKAGRPASRHRFTARTTGVSNPIRSPSFRSSASVQTQMFAFALGILHNINAFHCSTVNSNIPDLTLLYPSLAPFLG